MRIGDVPCNGCTRCCHGDAIRILPGEDASKWRTVPHFMVHGARMLDHKPNGDCWYLGDKGCTIHETKPQQCKQMDCRVIASRVTFTHARQLDREGRMRLGVWMKGRELMKQSPKGGW